LRRAFQGERLEKLLAEVTGYSTAPPQKRKEVVARRAGELKGRGKALQKQLRALLSPQLSAPPTPTLTIRADEPEVQIQMDEEGRLLGLTLMWKHAGLTVSVSATGHLWWSDQNTIAIALPSDRPDLIARHRDELTAWFGEIVHLNWHRTDTEAMVKVGNQRWRWDNFVRLPEFCPPDGWFALRDGNRWLWLKAAVRGGLQLLGTGGVRFTEMPMMPIALTPRKGGKIALSPSRMAALTTFAPAEALFVVRTPDGTQRLRRLQVVTQQIGEQRAIPLAHITATPTNELSLTVPIQPRWSLKREGDEDCLAWSVIWGENEIAWSPFGALHEVTITTDLGTKSLVFLTGVFAPMVQAIKAQVHEWLPSEGTNLKSRPLKGAHVAVYYCLGQDGNPDGNWRWKVAEGETDSSGTVMLLHPLTFGGFGAFWQTIAERPDWNCRATKSAGAFYESPMDGRVERAFFYLAPHEVVIPIEFVRRYPDGREEPAEVEVTVSRITNWKDERVLTRQLANGKMTLKVPTQPHDLELPPPNSSDLLRLEVRDRLTGMQRVEHFGIGAHEVYFWQPSGQDRLLVGADNAPVRVVLPVPR
jgi:hypothetical protein